MLNNKFLSFTMSPFKAFQVFFLIMILYGCNKNEITSTKTNDLQKMEADGSWLKIKLNLGDEDLSQFESFPQMLQLWRDRNDGNFPPTSAMGTWIKICFYMKERMG